MTDNIRAPRLFDPCRICPDTYSNQSILYCDVHCPGRPEHILRARNCHRVKYIGDPVGLANDTGDTTHPTGDLWLTSALLFYYESCCCSLSALSATPSSTSRRQLKTAGLATRPSACLEAKASCFFRREIRVSSLFVAAFSRRTPPTAFSSMRASSWPSRTTFGAPRFCSRTPCLIPRTTGSSQRVQSPTTAGRSGWTPTATEE